MDIAGVHARRLYPLVPLTSSPPNPLPRHVRIELLTDPNRTPANLFIKTEQTQSTQSLFLL